MTSRASIRRQTFIIGFASVILVLAAGLFGAFEFLELKANDAAFNLRGTVAPTPAVVIVAVDDESFTQTGLRWPWPRSYLAQIIDGLASGKPKAIVLDIALYAPAQGEETLAAAIKRAGNVILANSITIVSDPLYRLEQMNQPVPPLTESAASLGLSNIPRDADGFVRAEHGVPAWRGDADEDGAHRLRLAPAVGAGDAGDARAHLDPGPLARAPCQLLGDRRAHRPMRLQV